MSNSDCCTPKSTSDSHDEHRQGVRSAYAKVAQADNSGESCGTGASCCGVSDDAAINTLISTRLGYSAADLASVPAGADMGLGCGNPRAIASLKPGEVVLDLGAGGGFDCFLAAQEVGDSGHVIGVDMTPDMLSKARNNAHKGNFDNVEFRLGEIENLLCQHPDIKEGIVNFCSQGDGDGLLVAYVSPRDGHCLISDNIIGFLAEKLAEHMIPSVIVTLKKIPYS